MISKFDYFPCEVYREENLNYLDGLVDFIDTQHKSSVEDSLVYQTLSFGILDNFTDLYGYLKNRSLEILNSQGYETQRYEYKCHLWGQKISPGGYHTAHVHPNSQVCAFYFLRVPEGGSFPVFEDPRPGKKMGEIFSLPSEKVTSATPEIYFNNVETGTILYFNSWLPHKLTVNSSNEPTYFLHFMLQAVEK